MSVGRRTASSLLPAPGALPRLFQHEGVLCPPSLFGLHDLVAFRLIARDCLKGLELTHRMTSTLIVMVWLPSQHPQSVGSTLTICAASASSYPNIASSRSRTAKCVICSGTRRIQ